MMSLDNRNMLGAEVLAGYLMFATTTGEFNPYIIMCVKLNEYCIDTLVRYTNGIIFGQRGRSMGQC